MSSALDITSSVNPPRAAFLDYPLGHTTGKPHDPVLQREIMVEALGAFDSLAGPGLIKHLPFTWDPNDSWKQEGDSGGGDTRTPRLDTPQYQLEEDAVRANERVPEGCAVCGLHE